MAISKAQIDRLGERLRRGPHTESDLRLLDDYRRSFAEAYEVVVGTIRRRGEFPTGRPAKSTDSIVEKLRRESIRLSQMQDIAGCRVVVANVVQQEKFVASLRADFPGAAVVDRRDKPSHGYRAVHLIAEVSGKPMEVQVRTSLQHLWAEVSEKCSDVLDPAIKYGGGPESWRVSLQSSSDAVAAYERLETTMLWAFEKLEARVNEQPKLSAMAEAVRGELTRLQGEMAVMWHKIAEQLNEMIASLDPLPPKGQEE